MVVTWWIVAYLRSAMNLTAHHVVIVLYTSMSLLMLMNEKACIHSRAFANRASANSLLMTLCHPGRSMCPIKE